jgi:hypothetical protein
MAKSSGARKKRANTKAKRRARDAKAGRSKTRKPRGGSGQRQSGAGFHSPRGYIRRVKHPKNNHNN